MLQSAEFWIYQIADLADKPQPQWFYEHELSQVILDEREKLRIDRKRKESERTYTIPDQLGTIPICI